MRTKYKNQLFNLLKNSDFSPNDFSISFEENDEFPNTILSYKTSPFKFSIRESKSSFEHFQCKWVKYAPDYPISTYYPWNPSSFDDILNLLLEWLDNDVSNFEEDQYEPDLWEEYKEGQKVFDFNSIDFEEKGKFSIFEAKQISFAINELKFLIEKNFETSEKETTLINERLDYLIDSINNLNKFDWKSLVFSSIIGIMTTLTLDVEKGKLLFELVRQAFSTIHLLKK